MTARVGIPLFWKFTIAIVAVVLFFGSINVTVVWNHIRSSLRTELDQHALFIARSSARQSEIPMLHDDIVAMQGIIDDLIALDSTIAYAFIQSGSGRILAHSFETGVPFGILGANRIGMNEEVSRRHVIPVNTAAPRILDVAVPILDASVGVMRIGLREDVIAQSSTTLLRFLFVMVALFLVLGILGAFVFAHVISRPIMAISRVATAIAGSPAETHTFPRIDKHSWPLVSQHTHDRWPDEMDALVSDLNTMIDRLEATLSQLRRTQASLLQSEKLAAIGTLAAGIAHEINNPLAGLQNCVRRIQRHPPQDEKSAQYLVLIASAAGQIQHVVQGLLDFTRKHQFELHPVVVPGLLQEIIQLIAYRLQHLRIALVEDIQHDLPVLQASRNHLQQVLLNLIMNSIDAIQTRMQNDPSHVGELRISASLDGAAMHIAIRDNGTGIPAQLRDSVFDPFFTTKEAGKGTGLGLAVSYNIIHEHGGSIWVESEEDDFTEFTIALPLEQNGEIS